MWRWLKLLWSDPRCRAAGFAALLVAYCAYAVLLIMSESPYRARCPFLLLTGWRCIFCGMTRAVGSLLCGDWIGSWRLAPLTLPVLGWMVFGIGVLLRRAFGGPRPPGMIPDENLVGRSLERLRCHGWEIVNRGPAGIKVRRPKPPDWSSAKVGVSLGVVCCLTLVLLPIGLLILGGHAVRYLILRVRATYEVDLLTWREVEGDTRPARFVSS